MSYSIVKVIFGWNLSGHRDHKSAHQEMLWTVLDSAHHEIRNSPGFTSFYSGSAQFKPEVFGMEIAELRENQDRSVNSIDGPKWKEDLVIQSFNDLKEDHPEMYEYLVSLGSPTKFFLWTTS